MIDQENAIVDRLNSFLSVFLDLPPPSTIRPRFVWIFIFISCVPVISYSSGSFPSSRIYLSFLENTVSKYEMATTGNAPDDSVTHLHIFMEKLLMPSLSMLMWEAAYSKEVEDQDRIMSEKVRSILSSNFDSFYSLCRGVSSAVIPKNFKFLLSILEWSFSAGSSRLF